MQEMLREAGLFLDCKSCGRPVFCYGSPACTVDYYSRGTEYLCVTCCHWAVAILGDWIWPR
jgi:hypothetical protein